MSLFNPGKRGILTLLSVVLIIGIPGIVAYADSSSDTYYSQLDLVDFNEVSILDSSDTGTLHHFGVTQVEADGVYTLSFDDASVGGVALSTLTQAIIYQFVTESQTAFQPSASKMVFSCSLDDVLAVTVKMYSNGTPVGTFAFEYNSETSQWEREITQIEALQMSDVTYFTYSVTTAAAAAPSEIEVCYNVYDKQQIFTDDIVELIVLVGGIALLVIGTFSLSFIDLDTPGKAANSFIRGAKSAGRKVANYGRKKR